MHGKRIRIFHHGIMKQCNGCYKLGHLRWECKEEKQTWMDYVKTMRQSGKYTDSMFGTWIQEKAPESTSQSQQDLRQVLNNPGELKKMFANFLGEQMTKNMGNKRGQNDGNATRGGKRGRRGK